MEMSVITTKVNNHGDEGIWVTMVIRLTTTVLPWRLRYLGYHCDKVNYHCVTMVISVSCYHGDEGICVTMRIETTSSGLPVTAWMDLPELLKFPSRL